MVRTERRVKNAPENQDPNKPIAYVVEDGVVIPVRVVPPDPKNFLLNEGRRITILGDKPTIVLVRENQQYLKLQ